jgi:hypothetical protein
MKKAELELIIKRLDTYLGFNKDQIKQWLNTSCFAWTNSTPIDYLRFNMGYLILNHIDVLKENKDLYF